MVRVLFILTIFFALVIVANSQSESDTLNRTDEDGHKQGYWIKIDETGMKIYEGRFEADVPLGEFCSNRSFS